MSYSVSGSGVFSESAYDKRVAGVEMDPATAKLSEAFQRLFGEVSSEDRPALDSLISRVDVYFSKKEGRRAEEWSIGDKKGWYTEQGIFLRGGLLGRGRYNTVYRGEYLDSSDLKITDMAISFCKCLHPEEVEKFPYLLPSREKELIENLSSSRIVVPPLDYFVSEEKTFVVRKRYFSTASLSELKRKLGRELTREEKVQIALDVAHGVKALHDKGFLHRDIKDINIFVELETDGKLRAVLADLGLVGEEGDAAVYCGTFRHKPPELDTDGWTKAGDLYSLGAFLAPLFRGEEGAKELARKLLFLWPHARGTIDEVISYLEEMQSPARCRLPRPSLMLL